MDSHVQALFTGKGGMLSTEHRFASSLRGETHSLRLPRWTLANDAFACIDDFNSLGCDFAQQVTLVSIRVEHLPIVFPVPRFFPGIIHQPGSSVESDIGLMLSIKIVESDARVAANLFHLAAARISREPDDHLIVGCESIHRAGARPAAICRDHRAVARVRHDFARRRNQFFARMTWLLSKRRSARD